MEHGKCRDPRGINQIEQPMRKAVDETSADWTVYLRLQLRALNHEREGSIDLAE